MMTLEIYKKKSVEKVPKKWVEFSVEGDFPDGKIYMERKSQMKKSACL
jgi:hypothetical protein